MATHDECDYCINDENGIDRSPPLQRSDAISLYVRLQSQGYLPSMCENHHGKCRVCYARNAKAEH